MNLGDLKKIALITGLLMIVMFMFQYNYSEVRKSNVYDLFFIKDHVIIGPLYLPSGSLKIDVISDKDVELYIYSYPMGLFRSLEYHRVISGYRDIKLSTSSPTYYLIYLKPASVKINYGDKVRIEYQLSKGIDTYIYPSIILIGISILAYLPDIYRWVRRLQ